ncbi:hypothetical protein OSB04_024467 [Centaurea solstitialis]|uniref:Protein LURP-one-related 8 n=1 Tax=Centaurea solstitialis TaxID=347529 RepID=A0AA38WAD2_9ASTR|nr:hypothetical protein OSB04_024467 [Centaurea solstitialis]
MTKVYPKAVVPPPLSADRHRFSTDSDTNATVLTVWKKSLLFSCDGFTVFDTKGNLVFRVDNYANANKAEVVLMDASGRSLLTIRRKRLSLADSWLVYDGETAVNPCFSVTKNVNFLNSKSLARVSSAKKSNKNATYEIEGSYTQRSCVVYDDKKRCMAEIKRKEAVGGVGFGGDVFRLVVQPGMDSSVSMALIVILDQMFGGSSRRCVLLSSKGLVVADFAPLVAKVRARVLNWKAKFLSFGGRLQLIKSLLESLQLYWMMVFLLPVRVAWEEVCRPKESGGLGIKRLPIWNKALLTSHIWDILRHKKSIWVSWIYSRRLHNNHFWVVPVSNNSSWVWRKLLELREHVRPNFFCSVGEGLNINAWEDKWLLGGTFSSRLPYRLFSTTGFTKHSTVLEVNDKELISSFGHGHALHQYTQSVKKGLEISLFREEVQIPSCISTFNTTASAESSYALYSHPVTA